MHFSYLLGITGHLILETDTMLQPDITGKPPEFQMNHSSMHSPVVALQ